MKTTTSQLFMLLLVLTACSDDKEAALHTTVSAGIINEGMFHHLFDPALQINYQYDSLGHFHYGADSIDLNFDGDFDILINQRVCPDNIPISVTNYSYCSVTASNGWQLASKKESYPLGLSQWGTIFWVDTLLHKTRIDNLSEWSSSGESRWMWVNPPVPYEGTYGCWYSLTLTGHCIGIRLQGDQDFKYGWIKVFTIDRENYLFTEYAFEQ
jgi:hypothetical protein